MRLPSSRCGSRHSLLSRVTFGLVPFIPDSLNSDSHSVSLPFVVRFSRITLNSPILPNFYCIFASAFSSCLFFETRTFNPVVHFPLGRCTRILSTLLCFNILICIFGLLSGRVSSPQAISLGLNQASVNLCERPSVNSCSFCVKPRL